MTCSVLLLGGSGYVGNAFQSFFAAQEITFHNFSSRGSGYTNFSALEKVLRELRPSFVINAAGYTGKPNVDACEHIRPSAYLVTQFCPV